MLKSSFMLNSQTDRFEIFIFEMGIFLYIGSFPIVHGLFPDPQSQEFITSVTTTLPCSLENAILLYCYIIQEEVSIAIVF